MWDFSWIADPSAWAGLGTLIVLEVVLGIDNLVFISILTSRLHTQEQRRRAFLTGLGLALVMRLVLLSAITTVPGWYQKLAAKAGAGTLVPITGFANSVVSPAIEFKAEGWVTGVGARIFGIAGPVIAFGTLASFVWGVLYWLLGKVG